MSLSSPDIVHHKTTSPEKPNGRKPNFDRASFEAVRARLNAGQGHSAIAKATGVNRNAVIRIAQNPSKAEAAL